MTIIVITIILPNLDHHLNKLLKVHRPRPIPVSILKLWSEVDKKVFAHLNHVSQLLLCHHNTYTAKKVGNRQKLL